MSTLHSGSATNPAIMGDDDMEMSSEPGLEPGEDDIDIDIDFTVDQLDEDEILGDATSNVDFADISHAQRSPAVTNDDVMIDEDNASFPMDDADLIQEEADLHTQEETVAMSFGTAENIPSQLSEQIVVNSRSGPDGQVEESELTWEVNENSEEQVKEHKEPIPGPDQTSHNEENFHESNANSPEATPIASENLHGNSAASPIDDRDLTDNDPRSQEDSAQVTREKSAQHSPAHSQEASDPDNGSTAVAGPATSKEGIEREPPSKDYNTHLVSDIASGQSGGSDGTKLALSADALSLAPNVIVVYREVEYALYSKSESDDPDSFFLSDLSIISKPLEAFFGAIREVIIEDIAVDHELCMAVDDLDLEIEEAGRAKSVSESTLTSCIQTNTAVREITLGQIITLHERLVRNDGVEYQQPLCVALGSRPIFLRRYATLADGVSVGKGLSELVSWQKEEDESAEVLDSDSVNGEENHLDESEVVSAGGAVNTIHEEGVHSKHESKTVDNQPSPAGAAATYQRAGSDSVLSDRGVALDEPELKDTPDGAEPTENANAAKHDDENGEGDLIDYDDGDESNELQQRTASLSPEIQTDTTTEKVQRVQSGQKTAEEAIEEDLGTEYHQDDEYHGDETEGHVQHQIHEATPSDGRVLRAQDEFISYDEHESNLSIAPEDEPTKRGPYFESGIDIDAGAEASEHAYYFEQEGEEVETTDRTPSLDQKASQVFNKVAMRHESESQEHAADSSHLDDANSKETGSAESATASAHTLEADEISYESEADENAFPTPQDIVQLEISHDDTGLEPNRDHEDEIDYDEGEDEDFPILQGDSKPIHNPPNAHGASAKRPRPDEDLEDITIPESTAKRPRS